MSAALAVGDIAPIFECPTLDGNSHFRFDTLAGRHVLLLFAGSAGLAPIAAALRLVARHRELFDDQLACFFGVTSDPRDAAEGRIAKQIPGIRWFLDHDRAVAQRYGAVGGAGGYRPHWLLLDPMLRVLATAPLDGGEAVMHQLAEILACSPEVGHPPVLMIPRVFEPALCRRLIEAFEADGGKPSGFMRDVNGVTVGNLDDAFKRRFDFLVNDRLELRQAVHRQLLRILVPLIHRAFQFRVSRVERDLVACYNGDGAGGYFRPHRDNTTAGTAHRRFACSINLNAEEYEGGALRFPEFGSQLYRPPTGGALVFSCSLMHEATPVRTGKRYAYLPFLYDEEAARQREEIARGVKAGPDFANYRA